MNKTLFIIITILSTLLFFTNCTSVKTIVVDIEKPAQIVLPENIENIGIINNTVEQASTQGHINYKYTRQGKKTPENVNVLSDSISYLFTEELFQKLSENDRFKNISFYEYPIRQNASTRNIQAVDKEEIQDLSNLLNADAIISLDSIQINTTLHEGYGNYGLKSKTLILNVDLIFSIYSKEGIQISSPYYFSDSIYWNAIYSANEKFLFSEDSIPSREKAIRQGTIFASNLVTNSFFPTWTEQLRFYYRDNKEANKEAESNNWVKALEIWQKDFQAEEKAKKKARLANNIAIAYELSDNIEDALEWSKTSILLFAQSVETSVDQTNLAIAKLYREDLIARNKDFDIFNRTTKTQR